MTKKYEDIFARAQSSPGSNSDDLGSEKDGSEDILESSSSHSGEDEDKNEGLDEEENDDTSDESSEREFSAGSGLDEEV